MSSTPFGEHLKREREMRGVSLEEIAAATRISTRFLEAIENERWDQLPGGVFNRGFIRSIARFLGMDEDSLVAEYDLGAKSNGHSQTHSVAALPAQDLPRNWSAAVVAVLVLVVLIGGVTFTLVHYRSKISAGVHRGVAAVGAQIHRIRAKRHGALETASPPAKSASASPATPAAAVPAPAPAAAPSTAIAAPLILKLEAGKPANVKVLADGKVLFDGPVHVNDVKQFQAHDQFQVTSSESSALLLELNGQTVPPIGTPGQPGSVTLTRSDLSPAMGDAH
jgi:cytoskeleton protein RodZ